MSDSLVIRANRFKKNKRFAQKKSYFSYVFDSFSLLFRFYGQELSLLFAQSLFFFKAMEMIRSYRSLQKSNRDLKLSQVLTFGSHFQADITELSRKLYDSVNKL